MPGAPLFLGIVPRFGTAARLGDSQALPVTGRAAYSLGLDAGIVVSNLYTVELGYEHIGLLTEGDRSATGSLDVTRTVDIGWAMVRASLLRLSGFGLYVGIGAGVANNSATDVGHLSGAVTPINCSATGPLGLALRAGLGTEVGLSPRLSLLGEVGAMSAQLSSDTMASCAPGAGTITMLNVHAGVAYRFGVSRYLR